MDQPPEAVGLRLGGVERGTERGLIGHITGHELGALAKLVGELGSVGGGEVDDGDVSAGLDEAACGGKAEAGGPSGDGGGRTFELHVDVLLVRLQREPSRRSRVTGVVDASRPWRGSRSTGPCPSAEQPGRLQSDYLFNRFRPAEVKTADGAEAGSART